MKKLIVGAVVLFFTTATFAQRSTNGNIAKFGIKVGVNMSKYHFTSKEDAGEPTYLNDNQKSNIGFNITGYAEFGIAQNLVLQPAISIQNKGTRYKSDAADAIGELTQNTMWLEIPMNLAYNITTGDFGIVQISAGPYVGFGVTGKNKIKGSEDIVSADDINFKFGKDAYPVIGISGIDYGLNFGLGYRFTNGISFNGNYGFGLGNLIPKNARDGASKIKQKHKIIGLSVGFSF